MPEMLTEAQFTKKVLDLFWKYDIQSDLFWRVDDDEVSFFAMCSDVFFWGTADLEEIRPDRFELLKQSIEDIVGTMDRIYDATIGVNLFCARVRKMRPQGAAYPSESMYWEWFDECGPKRIIGMGNPKPHPGER